MSERSYNREHPRTSLIEDLARAVELLIVEAARQPGMADITVAATPVPASAMMEVVVQVDYLKPAPTRG